MRSMKNAVIILIMLAMISSSSVTIFISANAEWNNVMGDYGKIVVINGIKYTTHPIIRINSDAEFAQMAQQEGWPGDGSVNNPYIISGYDIDAQGGKYAIYMGNTTVYFIVENCYLHNATYPYSSSPGVGIKFYRVTHGIIRNNTFNNNNMYDITLIKSNENVISNNDLKDNLEGGIYLSSSNNNLIESNNITSNAWGWFGPAGIYIYNSFNNTICNNYVADECTGIDVYYSSDNLVKNNIIKHCTYGISIGSKSVRNTFYSNRIVDNGISMWGDKQVFTTQEIPINNTVNGKPIYYYKNANMNNASVPTDAGEVILGNVTYLKIENLHINNTDIGIEIGYSSHILIRNNTITNSWDSIYLGSSNNNTIEDNTITNSWFGIDLWSSNNNTIEGNVMLKNKEYGIHLSWESNHNLIFNNTFYYNNGAGDKFNVSHIQAYDEGSNNYWNNTAGYGNYWSDWANNNDTNDQNEDGIVDWPYPIAGPGGAKDYYPLKIPKALGYLLPPIDVKATPENGFINISWNIPENDKGVVEKFHIYRAINYDAPVVQTHYKLIANISGNASYYNDYNVTYGNVYTYYITASNRLMTSSCSNIASATLIPSWISWDTINYTNHKGKNLHLYDLNINLNGTNIVAAVSPLLAEAYMAEAYKTVMEVGKNIDAQQLIDFERDTIIATFYRMKEVHPSLGVINMDKYMQYSKNILLLKKAVNSLPSIYTSSYPASLEPELNYYLNIPQYGRLQLWTLYRSIILQRVKEMHPSDIIILGAAYEFPEYPEEYYLPRITEMEGVTFFSDLLYVLGSQILGHDTHTIYSIIGRIPINNIVPIEPIGINYYKNLEKYFDEKMHFNKSAELSGVTNVGFISVYDFLKNIENILNENGYATDLWTVPENSDKTYNIDLKNYYLFISGWHGNTYGFGTKNDGSVNLLNLHPMIMTGVSCNINNPPFENNMLMKGVTLIGNTGFGLSAPIGDDSETMVERFVSNMLTQPTIGDAWLSTMKESFMPLLGSLQSGVKYEFRLSGDPTLPIGTLNKNLHSSNRLITNDFQVWLNLSYEIRDGNIQLRIANENLPPDVSVSIINYSANAGDPVVPAILLKYNMSEDSSYTVYYSNMNTISYTAPTNEIYIITPDGLEKALGNPYQGIYPLKDSSISKIRYGNTTYTKLILFPVKYDTENKIGYVNKTIHLVVHTKPIKMENMTIEIPEHIQMKKGDIVNESISILANNNESNVKLIIKSDSQTLFNIDAGFTDYAEINLGNFSSYSSNISNSFRVLNLEIYSTTPGEHFINYTLIYSGKEMNYSTTVKVLGNYSVDVKIEKVEIPSQVYCNQTYGMKITLYNNGSINLTNVQVLVYINGNLTNNITIPELYAGETVTANVSFIVSVPGDYNITVEVVPYAGESNITNNNYNQKIEAIPSPVPELSNYSVVLLFSLLIILAAISIKKKQKQKSDG